MRAATRERVRSAAVRLFARQGYAAVNMRQIAVEAGISTGWGASKLPDSVPNYNWGGSEGKGNWLAGNRTLRAAR